MRVMESGSPTSPQHCGHELRRKLFFFSAATTARAILLGRPGTLWFPQDRMLGTAWAFEAATEEALRNTFSALREMHHWKLLSWHGRKPMVKIQRCSVNPEHNCQAEHCFPFHIPGLRQVFPLRCHTSDSITATPAAFSGI